MIRKATMDDAGLLFKWSNDPVTRENSFNSKVISLDEHLAWLKSKLEASDSFIYILIHLHDPIAVVRFEKNTETVIGINVAPEARGKGYSSACIELACEHYKLQYGDSILAYIKTENIASVKSFKKAGFVLLSESSFNEQPCYILKF